MMGSATLASIMRDINTTLREATGLRVYGNEVKEGFKRPCFFVQLLPIHDRIESARMERRLIMVAVQYFSEHGTDIENLAMADKLKEVFGLTIDVGGRKLTRGGTRIDMVDGVLQFRFDLDFYDTPAQAAELEPVDLMQELKIHWGDD
ncbi:MAG TPA: hypothetical protein PK003_10145 [Bacillota bacterium]|nr:hypothetical protein [Bacillota bacterium]